MGSGRRPLPHRVGDIWQDQVIDHQHHTPRWCADWPWTKVDNLKNVRWREAKNVGYKGLIIMLVQ